VIFVIALPSAGGIILAAAVNVEADGQQEARNEKNIIHAKRNSSVV